MSDIEKSFRHVIFCSDVYRINLWMYRFSCENSKIHEWGVFVKGYDRNDASVLGKISGIVFYVRESRDILQQLRENESFG